MACWCIQTLPDASQGEQLLYTHGPIHSCSELLTGAGLQVGVLPSTLNYFTVGVEERFKAGRPLVCGQGQGILGVTCHYSPNQTVGATVC